MKTLALILAFAAPQETTFTKDDVLKLSKAGIGDDVILAKIEQEKRSLKVTSTDLATLKEAGVSEKVLARLKDFVVVKPSTGSPKTVTFRNYSHRAVHVSIREADGWIDFSTKTGKELAAGASFELQAPPGEYAIAIEEWPTIEKVRVTESGGCILTVRGADTEYIDLQTIVADDEDGRRVVILHNQGKVTAGSRPRTQESYSPAEFGGPEYSYYPYICDSVSLGAGIGVTYASNGHKSGWGWYGSLGLFVGCGGWR